MLTLWLDHFKAVIIYYRFVVGMFLFDFHVVVIGKFLAFVTGIIRIQWILIDVDLMAVFFYTVFLLMFPFQVHVLDVIKAASVDVFPALQETQDHPRNAQQQCIGFPTCESTWRHLVRILVAVWFR